MIPNHSPWIKQLKRTRPIVPLSDNVETDVAIIGGGIAGVVTAYFTLRDTKKNVVLIEADKIAHGATGHNAGQITSYFERPLSDMVREFGLEMAVDGQRAVEGAWTLLEEICSEGKLQTPFYRFTGYAGLSSLEQILSHLKDNECRVKGGLPAESLLIAEESKIAEKIPKEYTHLFKTIAHKDLLLLLETHNTDYVATLAYQKGCMNSALFSEEVIGYLIGTYKNRFSFYEGSPLKKIKLKKNHALLEVKDNIVRAESVVLCTNGFENFSIANEEGKDIDTSFHHLVNGRIGYMTGYVEPQKESPTAISYFLKEGSHAKENGTEGIYFYLTRRPHEDQEKKSYNLICTGGPEKVLPHEAIYSREAPASEEMRVVIDEFLKKNFLHHPKPSDNIYEFCWHGLMGYTPNGMRRIGPEPLNPVLLYNLGCNGVGILPSIHGGKKIAQFLEGVELPKSVFDPHDQR